MDQCRISVAEDGGVRVLTAFSRSQDRVHSSRSPVRRPRRPPAREVLRTGRRLVIGDLATTTLLERSEAEDLRARGDVALLAVPVTVAGRNRAALELVETRAPRAFSGANVAFAEFMARQVARLIAGDEGREELPQRALDFPGDAPDAGRTDAIDAEHLLAVLAEGVRRESGAVACDIWRYDGAAETLVQAAEAPGGAKPGGASYPAAEFGAAAGTLVSGSVCSIPDLGSGAAGPHAARHDRDGARSVLATAVRMGDDTVGLLQVYGAEPGWIPGREEVALLEAGAAAAALVLSGTARQRRTRSPGQPARRPDRRARSPLSGHGPRVPRTDDAARAARAPRTGRLLPVPRRGRRRDAVPPRRCRRQPRGRRRCVAPGRLPLSRAGHGRRRRPP